MIVILWPRAAARALPRRLVEQVGKSEVEEAVKRWRAADSDERILKVQRDAAGNRDRPLADSVPLYAMEDMKGRIRVYVRVRPASRKEIDMGLEVACVKDSRTSITVLQPDKRPPEDKRHFDFDSVYAGADADGNSQTDFFSDVKRLVLSCVDGYNVCIFAYGQTGSGKTFTMTGPGSSMSEGITIEGETARVGEAAGIAQRSAVELFRLLGERSAQNSHVVVVTMFEVYCGEVRDLLAIKRPSGSKAPKLKIHLAQHSPTGLVHVDGAQECEASTIEELIKLLDRGTKARATSATNMNATSSRSHLLMSFTVKTTNRRTGVETRGKLTLVDLAGSERVDKSVSFWSKILFPPCNTF